MHPITLFYGKHGAVSIGQWIHDQKVWSSIPTVGVVQKYQAKSSFNTAVMGTRWNEEI